MELTIALQESSVGLNKIEHIGTKMERGYMESNIV
jgi:hypothetical protein